MIYIILIYTGSYRWDGSYITLVDVEGVLAGATSLTFLAKPGKIPQIYLHGKKMVAPMAGHRPKTLFVLCLLKKVSF